MWKMMTKDGFIWISDGNKEIKISSDKSKYGTKFAKREIKRRNIDPNINDFQFPPQEIEKIIKYFVKKTLYVMKANNLKISYEEAHSECALTYVKAIRNFIPGKTQFLTYMHRCWSKNLFGRNMDKLIKYTNQIKFGAIAQKAFKKMTYNVQFVSLDEEKKLPEFYLTSLSEKKAKILKCYYENGETIYEIAKKFVISPQAVFFALKASCAKIKAFMTSMRLTSPYIAHILECRLKD